MKHEEEIRKAEVLIEALSYIRKFRGKFVVIKLGGSVMENPESIRDLLIDVVFMQSVGMCPVVVHGGGKAITKAMADAGIEARFVLGRRYTDDATLDIVARVLAEDINRDLVDHINKFGGQAQGLHLTSKDRYREAARSTGRDLLTEIWARSTGRDPWQH